MIRQFLLMLIAGSFLAGTAWAEEGSGMKGVSEKESVHALPSFESLDKNHDNLISREEALGNKPLIKYWDKLDISLDGNLEPAEFSMLEPLMKREEALETGHPQVVEQYKNGKYISPVEQIERNRKEKMGK